MISDPDATCNNANTWHCGHAWALRYHGIRFYINIPTMKQNNLLQLTQYNDYIEQIVTEYSLLIVTHCLYRQSNLLRT